MGLLIDMKVKDFCDVLASNDPAPGGGSTAALSGALGASLTMMVANLSIGKKSYETLDQEIKDKFQKDFEEIIKIKMKLMELIDDDTEAFNVYMGAIKMPKDTMAEKKIREEAIKKAGIRALEVPLEVAFNCLLILRNQITIAEYGNKNAISDIGVGALLAFAGLEGAAFNVRINLPGISDDLVKKDASKRIEDYLDEGSCLKTRLQAIANRRI